MFSEADKRNLSEASRAQQEEAQSVFEEQSSPLLRVAAAEVTAKTKSLNIDFYLKIKL